jgi:hypothetical protein
MQWCNSNNKKCFFKFEFSNQNEIKDSETHPSCITAISSSGDRLPLFDQFCRSFDISLFATNREGLDKISRRFIKTKVEVSASDDDASRSRNAEGLSEMSSEILIQLSNLEIKKTKCLQF